MGSRAMDEISMNTNFLPYYKSAFSNGGMMQKRDLEQLYSMLKNITGEGSVTVQSDFGRGIRIIGDAGGGVAKSFSITQNGTSITVRAGTIRLQSSNESVAASTITLTGSPCWIYLYENVDHSTRGIDKSSTEPVNTATKWVRPLAQFTTTATGYELKAGELRADGDWDLSWLLK
jgi:hypothetical protein